MGHKTNVVGFRLGVPVGGEFRGNLAYHGFEDLHGYSSRWVASSRPEQAEWSKRDRELRRTVEEWLLVEGYLVNKIIITRSPAYVGIYVDAYRLEDRSLVTGLFGEARSVDILLGEAQGAAGEAVREVAKAAEAAKVAQAAEVAKVAEVAKAADAAKVAEQAPVAGGVPGKEVAEEAPLARPGRRVLEELLSRHVEWGAPVRLQVVALNELLSQVPTAVRESLQESLPKGKQGFSGDLRQVVALLGVVPCAPLLSKVLAYSLSGGRAQTAVLRLLKNFRKVGVRTAVSPRGASKGAVGLGISKRGAWETERLSLRAWSRPGQATLYLGRELESSRREEVLGKGVRGAAPTPSLSTGEKQAEVASVGAVSQGTVSQGEVSQGAESQGAESRGGESQGKIEGYGYRGYYIGCKGRVAGSERSRKVVLRAGTLPRHKRSAAIDQGFSEAHTTTGVVSVVVQVRVA